RLLDDFLIAALDRAFALAEVDDVAMPIREDLNFNVARIHDELFDEHPVVAEGRLRLRAGARQTLAEFALRMGNAHALAAPARRGLDHDGIADLGRDFCGLRVLGDDAKMAGN